MTQDPTYETIEYLPARVARIRLNRPERRNAQSRLMLQEVHDALMRAAADPEVRVIVVSGNGRDFSAGHDVKEMEGGYHGAEVGYDESAARYERLRRTYVEDHLAWRNISKPTIAAVQGYCIWGGWMVASAMDLVFAAEDARFLPTPYPADYWTLTWDLGQRKAKEILFEHRFVTAAEAERIGFVNRVYPGDDLEPATLAYAESVAQNDPIALRDLKAVVNQTMDGMGFTQSVHAAFHSGAARHRPSAYRQYGQVGPEGMIDLQGENPFARMVRQARERST